MDNVYQDKVANIDPSNNGTIALPSSWAASLGSTFINAIANSYANLVADGNTDNSANMATLLAGVSDAGGGIIYFPVGTYKFLSTITLPNDSASTPSQKSISFLGNGPSHNGQAGVPNGGTIFDLRSTTGPAKIDTRGLGFLGIYGITFKDGGSVNTNPFIQTTNTTSHIIGNEFYGTGTTQDAIILGGTSTTLGGGSNAPFQGYGTIIRGNYFNKIQRGVYVRTYGNGNVIADNIFWNQCGGSAAIELVGLSGNATTGNQICNNLIESSNYTFSIFFNDYALLNSAYGNSFYDQTGTTIGYYKCSANAGQNIIIGSYYDPAKPLLTDLATGNAKSTLIDVAQNQSGLWAQPQVFANTVSIKSSGNGVNQYDTTSTYYWVPSVTGTNGTQWILKYWDGSSLKSIGQFQYTDANNQSLSFFAATEAKIDNSSGAMRVRSGSGKELWLGDTSGNYGAYVLSGIFHSYGIMQFDNGENHKFRSPTVNVGGTTTIDVSTGQQFFVVMGAGNTTVTATNVRTVMFVVDVIQDGTGSRTITWDTMFKFPAGTAPTLTTTAGARDVLIFQGDQNYNIVKYIGIQKDVR